MFTLNIACFHIFVITTKAMVVLILLNPYYKNRLVKDYHYFEMDSQF